MECELYLIKAEKNVYTKTLLFKCLGLLCCQELPRFYKVLESISRTVFVRPAHRDPSHQLQRWACETGHWLYYPRRDDPQTSEEGSDEAPLVALRKFTSVSPIACPGQG